MSRHRISGTPSFVISLIALLFSLAGPAMAAVIIASNSQVARNTIAGHATTTGIHSNLISGTINGTDLSSRYKATLKVHCPAGLLAVGDLCVESALRGQADYPTALATCASLGRRLPNDAELALALTGLGAPQPEEWTEGHSYYSTTDGSGTMEELSDRSLVFGWTSLNNATINFRCVVSPHN